MPNQPCATHGCTSWTASAKGKWYCPKRDFSLQLRDKLPLDLRVRVCMLCWNRHRDHSLALDERLRIVPAGITALAAAPIQLDTAARPFVATPAVLDALYSTRSLSRGHAHTHAGLSLWSLQTSDFPLLAADGAVQPPHYSQLHQQQQLQSDARLAPHDLLMPLVPFNLPNLDPPAHTAALDDERQLSDVLQRVRECNEPADAESGTAWVPYHRDNQEFSAWQSSSSSSSSTSDSRHSHSRSRKRRRTAAAAGGGHTHQPAQPVGRSPLNPHLFALDSANLCRLMAKHYSFPGFSSPSWYVKSPGSFFCMHVEQLFAPFYNLCYDGGTTWWVVRREDRAKLDGYIVQRARRWYGVSRECALSEHEAAAVAGLLYTKQLVFHPDDLAAAGVRLTRVDQPVGTIVVGDGDLVHFGVTATPPSDGRTARRSVNEAVNFLPLQWLTTGLPRLLEWMRWLHGH